ncbi:MAG TPA: methyltransferase domain-containing protein [Anaerolineae bacterium]|nr:methyltransferase domain-containing protein [Anaerolineae bacterium]
MTWLWVGVGLAGALLVAGLIYWQMIVAEGAYLGPRAVAWTYDVVARRYDAIKQFDPSDEKRYLAEPLLRKLAGVENPLVLDVATGTGRLPLALLHTPFSGQILGLDLSLKMLRVARSKLLPYGDRVDLVWHGAGHLPFGDGLFDAVTCLEALEFFPHPAESLVEMARVLAPGGVLFTTNRVGREAIFLPRHAIRRKDLERMLAALGLREVETRRWQVSYDLVMARKEGRPGVGRKSSAGHIALLRCPACAGTLEHGLSGLYCTPCRRSYPLRDGIMLLASG